MLQYDVTQGGPGQSQPHHRGHRRAQGQPAGGKQLNIHKFPTRQTSRHTFALHDTTRTP